MLKVLATMAAVCAVPPCVVSAADQETPDLPLSIERIEVGFAGQYKVGRWTPLTVLIKVEGACHVQLFVEVPDPDGNRTVLPGEEIELARAGHYPLEAYFKSGQLKADLRIRIRVRVKGSGPVEIIRTFRPSDAGDAEFRPALRQAVSLLITLGKAAGFAEIADANGSLRVVELDNVEQLPQQWLAYDAVDMLAIHGAQKLTTAQSRAIHDWVQMGGHLFVSVGRDTTAFQEGTLYEWMQQVLPLAGQESLRNLSGLEGFSGRNVRIVVPPRREVPVAKIRIESTTVTVTGPDGIKSIVPGFEGVILASQINVPLIVRVPFGFGRVTLFTLDLDRPPLADWEPLSDVIRRLVSDRREDVSNEQRTRQSHQLTHSGISDLSTQLNATQEQFSDVDRFSRWTIMSLLLLYVLVIGPADYFLVHRLFRAPRLTWLTFPLMIAAAAGLAAWAADRTNNTRPNGNRVRINQIDLIDIDAHTSPSGSQLVRTKTWLTVYSPKNHRYKISVEPLDIIASASHGEQVETLPATTAGTGPQAMRVAWNGVPENSFGGMYRERGIEFDRIDYRFAPFSAEVSNLPIRIWSTKALTAEHRHEAAAVVESNLVGAEGGRLSGTLLHRLGADLEDWVLAYGLRAYYPTTIPRSGQLASLPPHKQWSLNDPSVRQRTLEGFLTGARQRFVERVGNRSGTDFRLEQTAYDSSASDPAQILKMITFYRRAGGKRYTGLDNHALRSFDFSPLLDLNRAILLGRIDRPAARMEIDGTAIQPARHSAFVRIVLPVKRRP